MLSSGSELCVIDFGDLRHHLAYRKPNDGTACGKLMQSNTGFFTLLEMQKNKACTVLSEMPQLEKNHTLQLHEDVCIISTATVEYYP